MMPPNMLTPENEVVSDYVRLRDDQELSARAGEALDRLNQSENARANHNHDSDAFDPLNPPDTLPQEQPHWYTPAKTPARGRRKRRPIFL